MKRDFKLSITLKIICSFALVFGMLTGCTDVNSEKGYRSIESIYTDIHSSPETIVNDDQNKTLICFIYGIVSKTDVNNESFYLQDDHNAEQCIKCIFDDSDIMEGFFKKYKNGDAIKLDAKIYRDKSGNYYAFVVSFD